MGAGGYNQEMNYRLVITALAIFCGWTAAAAQAPPSTAAADETARLNAWFEARFEEQLAFSPIQQTFLGRKSGAIDDMSLAAQDRLLEWQRATVAGRRASTTPR